MQTFNIIRDMFEHKGGYMSILSSYVCPKCNYPFPLFFRPSMLIFRGLLPAHLKCPNCGQVCRQKIDFMNAAWIWPLTVIFFAGSIYVLRTYLYHRETLGLYILLGCATLFFFLVGLRRGMKLEKVEDSNIKKGNTTKWYLPAVGITVFSLLFGYYTHNWPNVLMGIIIGFVVWGFYYCFSRKTKQGQ